MTTREREALYALVEIWRTSIPIPCDADLITQAGIEGQEEQAAICAQALIDKLSELQACEMGAERQQSELAAAKLQVDLLRKALELAQTLYRDAVDVTCRELEDGRITVAAAGDTMRALVVDRVDQINALEAHAAALQGNGECDRRAAEKGQ